MWLPIYFTLAIVLSVMVQNTLGIPMIIDKKGKAILREPPSAAVETEEPASHVVDLSKEEMHPTLKKYLDLDRKGYTRKFYTARENLIRTDDFLKSLEGIKTPAEYNAEFNKLRPKHNRSLEGRANASINNSVTSLMTAHLKYLNKPKIFHDLAKGRRMRESRQLANEAKNEGKWATKRKRQPDIVLQNALQFANDMKAYKIKPSDDPYKFEQDTRLLIPIHEKGMTTRRLADYLQVMAKSEEFRNQVLDLRLRHNVSQGNLYRPRRQHLLQQFCSPSRITDTASPNSPNSYPSDQVYHPRPLSSSLHNFNDASTSTRPSSSSIADTVVVPIHTAHERDKERHDEALTGHVKPPASDQRQALASSQTNVATSSRHHAARHEDWSDDVQWWKTLLN